MNKSEARSEARPTKSVFSQEHCDRIRQSKLGKKHSEETKQKIRDGHARRRAMRAKSIGVGAE